MRALLGVPVVVTLHALWLQARPAAMPKHRTAADSARLRPMLDSFCWLATNWKLVIAIRVIMLEVVECRLEECT